MDQITSVNLTQAHQNLCTHPNFSPIASTIEQNRSSSATANLTGITFNNIKSTKITSNSNQNLQNQLLKFKNPRLAISNTCFILFLCCVAVVCCCGGVGDGGGCWWSSCIVGVCWPEYLAMGADQFAKIRTMISTHCTKFCTTDDLSHQILCDRHVSHKNSNYIKFRLFFGDHNLG